MARPSFEKERRAQIMAATRRVMVSRGVKLLRVADVAHEAGLSPGIVHYYFASKDELIRETFEDNFASSLARRSSIIEQDLPADTRLDQLLRSYLPIEEATRESWVVWLELWVGALQDPSLRSINEHAYDQWRRLISGIIREGCESGVFTSEDPAADTNQLVAMIDGLAVQALLESSVISPEEMHHICTEFVAERLTAK